jgi:hypothetical protein
MVNQMDADMAEVDRFNGGAAPKARKLSIIRSQQKHQHIKVLFAL